jgi:hypothetical protein
MLAQSTYSEGAVFVRVHVAARPVPSARTLRSFLSCSRTSRMVWSLTTGEPPLSWWGRDSAGRWHTASGGSWGRHGDREWTGVLQLRPPLHPAATSLELTVTGTSERLRIGLPLHWHAEERRGA